MLNTKLLSDPTLHRCTLAEEIGHHLTGAKSNLLKDNQTSTGRIQMQIDEYNARIWAANFLVPSKEFVKLYALNFSIQELAGHFMVTEDIIRLRLFMI